MKALTLWEFAAQLKSEPRRGWKNVSGINRTESVADHSFGVAVLTLFESSRRGYDVKRALTLALIHDLEEALTGDLTPADKAKISESKLQSLKTKARLQITQIMPANLRSDYRKMWRELETRGSREARLVKDLDKLEMALQARRYQDLGGRPGQLAKFYKSALAQIEDAEIRKTALLLVEL